MNTKAQTRMERINARVSINDVLSLIGPDRKNICGHSIKMKSVRYRTFAIKGCVCVGCGLEGKYFIIERHPNIIPFHLNLYAIDEFGDEVLMTVDHIVPASKGGRRVVDNLQPMCTICNHEKANKTPKG